MGRQLSNLSGRITVAVICLLLAPAGLQADGFSEYGNVEFVVVEQERGLPVRGTTSKTVLNVHGEPSKRRGPVGSPPISVWHYDSFDVYFEDQLVITTVDKDDTLPFELEGITQ